MKMVNKLKPWRVAVMLIGLLLVSCSSTHSFAIPAPTLQDALDVFSHMTADQGASVLFDVGLAGIGLLVGFVLIGGSDTKGR